jgi:hypothetical protein
LRCASSRDRRLCCRSEVCIRCGVHRGRSSAVCLLLGQHKHNLKA